MLKRLPQFKPILMSKFVKKMNRIIISIILFFSLIPVSLSLTLSDIRSEIRRNLRDTATTSSRQRYSDSILLSYINESQRAVLNHVWLTESTTIYSLIGGTTFYDLPTDYLGIKNVLYKNSSGQTLELKEKSYKSLIQQNADWDTTDTSDPTQYTVLQTTETAMQISYVGIPPASSTGTLTIRYFNQPVDLSSDSDIPFDGKLHLLPYHIALVYHSSARIKILEGKVGEATTYIQLFNGSIETMSNRLGQSPNLQPSLRGFTSGGFSGGQR